ncbi:MAG: UDP-2,3-diacylglucosamine diphosphatase [Pseudomonadota bacterium]
MAETLILADLHLREQAPAVTRRLLALESRLLQADAVYILGDLVEVWIGDDAPIPAAIQSVFELLLRLSSAGIPLYFQHGNRDFLIGKALARRLGMRLLPDQFVVDLYGHRAGLVHGDQLCTDDLPYQRMRRKLRNPILKFILRHLPLRTRQKLAADLRERSRMETGQKTAASMDVNAGAVDALMTKLDVDVLIHGHTHRPAIHRVDRDIRAVLGDWEDGAVLLSASVDGLRLERIEDSGATQFLALTRWPDQAI